MDFYDRTRFVDPAVPNVAEFMKAQPVIYILLKRMIYDMQRYNRC